MNTDIYTVGQVAVVVGALYVIYILIREYRKQQ